MLAWMQDFVKAAMYGGAILGMLVMGGMDTNLFWHLSSVVKAALGEISSPARP